MQKLNQFIFSVLERQLVCNTSNLSKAILDLPVLSLNCFVLGDDTDNVFTIKLPKTNNVSILKKMIEEEKAHLLTHIDVSDLELFQVP